MAMNAGKEKYDVVDVDGRLCLFTNMRLDRNTIPPGLHCYDVRDSDFLDGSFCEIKPFVMVNHGGRSSAGKCLNWINMAPIIQKRNRDLWTCTFP